MKVGFDEVLTNLRNGKAWRQASDEDEKAQAIACAVIETYGDLTPHEWELFRKNGKIWRDHCAYQAALAGLRMAQTDGQRPDKYTRDKSAPCDFGERRDGSVWLAFGPPLTGGHYQADFNFPLGIAAYISRAVNCHDDLLAACRTALRLTVAPSSDTIESDIAEIRAAIAKADGKASP